MMQQHEREQPDDFGLVGEGDELAGEADRLGGQVDVAAVAHVEDEVEHPQHRSEVSGLVEPDTGDPPLARLIRCAIVGSGTRYAVAICRVVRPATARSVSATAELGGREGCVHRK
jgi:hypothetical protein